MSRFVVILMDGRPATGEHGANCGVVHAAWVIDGDREQADAFARFVTEEIDPAIVVEASDPVREMILARAAARNGPGA